jgi:hypothetical protein
MRAAKPVCLDVPTHFAAVHESGSGPMLTTWALPQAVSYLGHTGGDPEDLRGSSSPLKRSANACATSAVPKQNTVKSRPSRSRRYVVARRPAPSRARRWACCSRRHLRPRPATRPDVATAGRAGFGWSCLLTSSRDFVPPHGDQLLDVRPKLEPRSRSPRQHRLR